MAYSWLVRSVSCPSWVRTAPLRSLEYRTLWQRSARGRRLVDQEPPGAQHAARGGYNTKSDGRGAGSKEQGLQG